MTEPSHDPDDYTAAMERHADEYEKALQAQIKAYQRLSSPVFPIVTAVIMIALIVGAAFL
jgi:type II secretory pathway component PulF